MAPAIFLGKPSKGFICCYLSLTQVVLLVILVAFSYSIYMVNEIMRRDSTFKPEYVGRLIYLSIGLAIVVAMEVVIFTHIGGLVYATKNAEKLAKLKKKQVVLMERNIVTIPSAYEIIY